MTKPIVVCIDTRDLRIATTGSKTYLEEICRELKKGYPGFSFRFIDTWFPVYTGGNKFLKAIEHLRYFGWKQFTLPLACLLKGCDILYCTDYFLPLVKLNYKTAVVFYDAFFWEYPEHYNRFWLKLLNSVGVAAARKADAVITITEYSRKQIIKYVGINPGLIHAIHLAPKSMPRVSIEATAIVNELSEGRKQGLAYILHVGSFDKRKNLATLVLAFDKLVRQGYSHLRLLLVGESSPKQYADGTVSVSQLIQIHNLQDFVIRTGYTPDSMLPFFYDNACMYVFPSLNEGFGLPVVEAFASGLPVIVSNNTCLPEIGGDAVLSFNPHDPEELCATMKLLIENEDLRKELIRKGKQRLPLFSWERSARQLLDVFEQLYARR